MDELTGTVIGHPPQTAITIYGIGLADSSSVGNQHTERAEVELQIQVVVCQIHAVLGILS